MPAKRAARAASPAGCGELTALLPVELTWPGLASAVSSGWPEPERHNNELPGHWSGLGLHYQPNHKVTGGTFCYSESWRKLRYESLEDFSGPLWTAGSATQLYLTNRALHDGNIFIPD